MLVRIVQFILGDLGKGFFEHPVRNSVSVGPFRFNLAKSGVEASVGIPGMRVGMGPRSNYVHAGKEGFVYKGSLPAPKATKRAPTALRQKAEVNHGDGVMHEIESGSVLDMFPQSAATLLSEINGKQTRVRLSRIVLWLWAVVMAFCFFSGNLQNWMTVAYVAAPSFLAAMFLDKVRRSVILLYDFEPEILAKYESMIGTFRRLQAAEAIWHIEAQGKGRNWKRNAGAISLQNRNKINVTLSNPDIIRSNIDVPTIPVGKQVLYFYPDRILVVENSKVGAVEYAELKTLLKKVKFIEKKGQVPADARVIEHTWKHPNKDGSRDRRFNDNEQLPVCAYEELHFTSQSGLNELIQVSLEGRILPFTTELWHLASIAFSKSTVGAE